MLSAMANSARMNRTDRVTTITGLAKRLGLSPTTVSFVLNGQGEERKIASATIDRVLAAVAETDYVPNALARGLRQKRTHAIGVVFPHLRGDWAHRVMEGMSRVLSAIGTVPLIVCHSGSGKAEVELLRSLMERRVDGIICNPLPDGSSRYRRVLERGTPLAFLGDCPGDLDSVSFAGWDPGAVAVVVRHLISLGHKRIAFLGVRDDRRMSRARFDAFQGAVNEAGLECPRSHVIMNEPGRSFEPLVRKMLSRPDRPTALFALYDDIAIEAVKYLRAGGMRCPQDVSVATIGNAPLVSAPGYELTTVTAPVEDEGHACAECLLRHIDDAKAEPIHRFVPGGELVIGRTTAAPPR